MNLIGEAVPGKYITVEVGVAECSHSNCDMA